MAFQANYSADGISLKKVYVNLISMTGSVNTGWTGSFGIWSSKTSYNTQNKPFKTISVYTPETLELPQKNLQNVIQLDSSFSSIVEV